MTPAAPRFGIALPQSAAGEPGFAARVADFVRAAESSGMDSLWVQEQLLGTDPSIEPLVNLAFAAALTTHIRLGVAVVVAPVRNPVVLAKQIASLDRLSAGRLTVGLGLGDLSSVYQASGVPIDGRAARLEQVVALMSHLWTQSPADYRGGGFHLAAAAQEPTPVQTPHPPLWFAARSLPALRRAVRLGSGWIAAGGASTKEFRTLSAHLPALVPESRRDTFTVAKKIYFAIEHDPIVAQSRLATWFHQHWGAQGPALAREVGIAGTIGDCVRNIRHLTAAGANLIICNPVYDELTQLHRLVDHVIPRIVLG